MGKTWKTFGWKWVTGIFCFLEAVIVIVLGTSAVLLRNSIVWMFETWRYLTMDELVYHLRAPMEGTNLELILSYINDCIPGAILTLLFLLVLVITFSRRKKIFHVLLAGVALVSVLVAGNYLHLTWERLDLANYSRNQSIYSTFLDENYVDPREVEIQFPEKKRNLIYIILESMETTYTDKEDGGAFERGCIPELTEIAQENEDFSGPQTQLNGGYSMPHTIWTIAGIFAQTAGLPLDIPIERNDMYTQDTFFPGVVTLGDILEEQGYSQTFLLGSDVAFGGRKIYFTEHGHYQLKDYYYAVAEKKIPEDYRVFWGYEDRRLLQFAKEELLELSEGDRPFNFTMLTVDTHYEDGFRCENCGDAYGEDQYANVMACSSEMVAELVRWIQQQDFYENTTIVLTGDHPTMDSNFCEGIDADYVRKVYTAYIHAAVPVERPDLYRDYTTFDYFPTTLASIGARIEGNRLGLGTNLFSSEWTLTEMYERDRMEEELNRQSELMVRLASDIKPLEPQKEETEPPSAEVAVYEYNSAAGLLPVGVREIRHIQQKVTAVNVAVWTEENQEDLQWVQTVLLEDGSYGGYIDLSGFGYKTGEYYVEACAVFADGSQVTLGNASGQVE
ncbi:MAG: sulfatase-like hydrolase/transferase [Ruminococcus sp.]|nr:sulfatase-like hydrolase/transferase [Ruminococcus sp.]